MCCFYLFHSARLRVDSLQTKFCSNLCEELCLFLLDLLHCDVWTLWVAMRFEVVAERILVVIVFHLQTCLSKFGQKLSYTNLCEE